MENALGSINSRLLDLQAKKDHRMFAELVNTTICKQCLWRSPRCRLVVAAFNSFIILTNSASAPAQDKPDFDGVCEDNVACTIDAVKDGECTHTPDDSYCQDNGIYCDGVEYCNVEKGCVSKDPPCYWGCDSTSDACQYEPQLQTYLETFWRNVWGADFIPEHSFMVAMPALASNTWTVVAYGGGSLVGTGQLEILEYLESGRKAPSDTINQHTNPVSAPPGILVANIRLVAENETTIELRAMFIPRAPSLSLIEEYVLMPMVVAFDASGVNSECGPVSPTWTCQCCINDTVPILPEPLPPNQPDYQFQPTNCSAGPCEAALCDCNRRCRFPWADDFWSAFHCFADVRGILNDCLTRAFDPVGCIDSIHSYMSECADPGSTVCYSRCLESAYFPCRCQRDGHGCEEYNWIHWNVEGLRQGESARLTYYCDMDYSDTSPQSFLVTGTLNYGCGLCRCPSWSSLFIEIRPEAELSPKRCRVAEPDQGHELDTRYIERFAGRDFTANFICECINPSDPSGDAVPCEENSVIVHVDGLCPGEQVDVAIEWWRSGGDLVTESRQLTDSEYEVMYQSLLPRIGDRIVAGASAVTSAGANGHGRTCTFHDGTGALKVIDRVEGDVFLLLDCSMPEGEFPDACNPPPQDGRISILVNSGSVADMSGYMIELELMIDGETVGVAATGIPGSWYPTNELAMGSQYQVRSGVRSWTGNPNNIVCTSVSGVVDRLQVVEAIWCYCANGTWPDGTCVEGEGWSGSGEPSPDTPPVPEWCWDEYCPPFSPAEQSIPCSQQDKYDMCLMNGVCCGFSDDCQDCTTVKAEPCIWVLVPCPLAVRVGVQANVADGAFRAWLPDFPVDIAGEWIAPSGMVLGGFDPVSTGIWFSGVGSHPRGVSRVEYFVDEDLVLETQFSEVRSSQPIQSWFDLSGVVDGPHVLTAMVYSRGRYPSVSMSGVQVEVTNGEGDGPCEGDTTPPEGNITWPREGDSVISGIWTVTVAATDSSGIERVEVYVDGSRIGVDRNPPFAVSWDAAEGLHAVQARVVDICGRAAWTATRNLSVQSVCSADVVVDMAMIVTPAGDVSLDGGCPLNVEVQASDRNGVAAVAFRVDGFVVNVDSDAPYEYSDWGLDGGVSVLDVVVYDDCGNHVIPGVRRIHVVDNGYPCMCDSSAPLVSVVEPQAGSWIPHAGTRVRVAAEDNLHVDAVVLEVDGTVVPDLIDTIAPFDFALQPTRGTHSLRAFAVDVCGNWTWSGGIVVAVQNGRPSPADDNFVVPGDVGHELDVLANDSDPDGDAIKIGTNSYPVGNAPGISQSPAHGIATRSSNESVRYTPNHGYRGTDEFWYRVVDDFGGFRSARVVVNVR